MVDLVFVFNSFNAEKRRSEMVSKGKLNGNKYIHFHITPMKEIWVFERLFSELVTVKVNDKKCTVQSIQYII